MSLTLKKSQQGGYIPVSQCATLEITFIKTSGTVGRDRGKNWQIADSVASPITIPETNYCWAQFDSSVLPFSKVANTRSLYCCQFFCFHQWMDYAPAIFFCKILLTCSLSTYVGKLFKQILPHSGHLLVLIVQEFLSTGSFVVTQALFVLLTSYGCYYTGFD